MLGTTSLFGFVLLAVGVLAVGTVRADTGLAEPLTDAEAWKRLPAADKGGGQTLPDRARMLAGPLPKTTAAMLQVDYAHRTRSPLDPKLRAAMRWVAARANGCSYSQAYAVADARRTGISDGTLTAFEKGDFSTWTADEKASLERDNVFRDAAPATPQTPKK